MSLEQTKTLAMLMSKEQPYVMAYLLACSETTSFNDDEADIFFNVGNVLWMAMKQHKYGIFKVTEQDLDNAEQLNYSLLKTMKPDDEWDLFSITEAMTFQYPEPELLRYVTESVLEVDDDDNDNPLFREENIGKAFLDLKIVLDAFISRRKI